MWNHTLNWPQHFSSLEGVREPERKWKLSIDWKEASLAYHQPLTTEEQEFSGVAVFPPKERPLGAAKPSVTQEIPSERQGKGSKEWRGSVQECRDPISLLFSIVHSIFTNQKHSSASCTPREGSHNCSSPKEITYQQIRSLIIHLPKVSLKDASHPLSAP